MQCIEMLNNIPASFIIQKQAEHYCYFAKTYHLAKTYAPQTTDRQTELCSKNAIVSRSTVS